jgi:hypothetical protein
VADDSSRIGVPADTAHSGGPVTASMFSRRRAAQFLVPRTANRLYASFRDRVQALLSTQFERVNL